MDILSLSPRTTLHSLTRLHPLSLHAGLDRFPLIPYWMAPYAFFLLLHAAKAVGLLNAPSSRRLGAALHRRSPSWLRRAARWVWGPNIGLLLHLCRLLLMAAVGTGYIHAGPYFINAASVPSRRRVVMVGKILIQTAESYDLRVFLAVTLLLDYPVYWMFYRRLGLPYALELYHLVTVTAVVALCRWWRIPAVGLLGQTSNANGMKSLPKACLAGGASSAATVNPAELTTGKAKLQ